MKRIVISILVFCFSCVPILGFAQSQEPRFPQGAKSKETFFKSVTDRKFSPSPTPLNKALDPPVSALIKDAPWRAMFERGGVTLEKDTPNDTVYTAQMSARGLDLPEKEWAMFDAAGLGHQFSVADLTMKFHLNKPWSSTAINNGAITRIELANVVAQMGGVMANATGYVNLDENQKMYGKVNVEVKNWQALLSLLNASDDSMVATFAKLLGQAATGDVAKISGVIKESRLYIGPIAILSLPNIKM